MASVDASGIVRGVSEGTATVTAASGGTSEITVENPDRAALVALYEATDGPNWTYNDGWRTEAPLREWHDVATDDSGRAVNLTLIYDQLTGPIPPELGKLVNLRG